MDLIRKILFPLVPIYYLVTWLRNLFYDLGLFPSKSYDMPVITVGNLSVGGTGKTPAVEYLIRLLKNKYRLATLSRGYKRKSTGFIIADNLSTPQLLGDEPFQMSRKFEDIIVSVDENRQRGISSLMSLTKSPHVILLDDAFQHRKVNAGLNILLTAYTNLYTKDILLPTGNLREPRSGAKRADIIVVTKCPKELSDEEKSIIQAKINPEPNQDVFFSTINYSKSVYSDKGEKLLTELKQEKFSLVTGIANAKPLVDYLKDEGYSFEHLNFPDHHNFTLIEISNLNTKDLILTTEKDFWRLSGNIDAHKLYYLPIEMEVSEGSEFNGLITKYVIDQLS